MFADWSEHGHSGALWLVHIFQFTSISNLDSVVFRGKSTDLNQSSESPDLGDIFGSETEEQMKYDNS